MSNLRLKDHTWDAANVYDSSLGKTQDQINAEVGTSLAGKQETLVSGVNIKTINGASILDSGNIEIEGGGTGEDGYSPVVTISNITGGHRVNITDKTHQQGQNFDVMDGAKGDTGDPAPASAVVPAVESWLEENITQETGYVIDDSLTVTGAAADAKKTGDELSDLKSANSDLLTIRETFPGKWTQGGIRVTTGENASSDKRGRSNSMVFDTPDYSQTIHVSILDGYRVGIFEYLDNDGSLGSYTGRYEWYDTLENDITINNAYRYRFVVSKSDSDSELLVENIPDGCVKITYLHNEVSTNITKLTNTINLSKYEEIPYSVSANHYVNASTGETAPSTLSMCTDFIDVSKYGMLYYSRMWTNGTSKPLSGMAFYDSSKNYLSGEGVEYNASGGSVYDDVLGFIIVPNNAKYARFSLLQSTVPGPFYLYGVPRIKMELEKATFGFTTKRNNPSYVQDMITIARSYLSQGLTYGFDSILSVSTATNEIDCSTFVGLCLRGYSYSETSYNTHNWTTPDSWIANSAHVWSINPFDWTMPRFAEFPLPYSIEFEKTRTAAELAQWMIERGWTVPMDEHLANLEPGDILFYARKNSNNEQYLRPDRFMHINHCAICISKEPAPDSETWDKTKYPYKHTLIDSRQRSGSIGTDIVETGQNDPTDIYHGNINTLILVCRPDLGSI